MRQELKNIEFAMDSICIFKGLLEDEVLKNLKNLATNVDKGELSKSINYYRSFVFSLLKQNENLSIREYIINKLISFETPVTDLIDKNLEISDNIIKALDRELYYLHIISNLSSRVIKNLMINNVEISEFQIECIGEFLEWNNECNIEFEMTSNNLIEFYKTKGTGEFSKFKAFVWKNGKLNGIEKTDPIKLDALIGYEHQKETIIKNTLQFIKGGVANNILLYGSRGTGKSSTVKALINEYYEKGLRLIEVDKKDLVDFVDIIDKIRDKNLKFIIFVDDLTFQDGDESYSALKTILEGRIQNRPDNILIYATSNRRHLVVEKFSDSDEIHSKDTVEEKLSLSDRFGITVSFLSPDQREYLKIVDGIAEERGLDIDKEVLHKEAIKWAMWQNGRSPRTAKQFINSLE